MSFTAIASLFNLDPNLEKFAQVIATSHLGNIATAISQALEGLLKVDPLIEVMKLPSGVVVFRHDQQYYTVVGNAQVAFDPFTADAPIDGDVYSSATQELVITHRNLQRMWGVLYFDYIANPVLHQLIADVLTYDLNEEQEWTSRFSNDGYDFLQEYINIGKLFMKKLPHRLGDYHALMGMRDADGEYTRDLWFGEDVEQALKEIMLSLQRILVNFFPAVRSFTERSVHPAYGYDVFLATVEAGNELVVKKLGDYRILQWELQQ